MNFSHGISFQLYSISIEDEPIHDGVSQGGVRHTDVPIDHGHLSDDQGGAVTIAVIQDFKQVTGLNWGQRV